jgi:prepilin-type N-terminal cleavage/methylation domain-containing protein/prepilin-type processing-associated H-X9-DG protein
MNAKSNRTRLLARSMMRGFTLIELLVVIAIIAVLAAILFPVFAAARERAQSAACINNLNQIGSAFALYSEDWEEVSPLFFSKSRLKDYVGFSLLAKYLQKPGQGVWICPSDTLRETAPEDWDPLFDDYYSSYAPSAQFFGLVTYSNPPGWTTDKGVNIYGRPLDTVRDPARKITVFEGWDIWVMDFPYVSDKRTSEDVIQSIDSLSSYGLINAFVGQRHQQRGNYLFADGHVRSLTLRQTLEPVPLWDNLDDWCPECLPWIRWTEIDIQSDLMALKGERIP